MSPVNIMVKSFPFLNIVHEFFMVDVKYIQRIREINKKVVNEDVKNEQIRNLDKRKVVFDQAFRAGITGQVIAAVAMVALGFSGTATVFALGAAASIAYNRWSDRFARAYVNYQDPGAIQRRAT